jgi:hypothetical protein
MIQRPFVFSASAVLTAIALSAALCVMSSPSEGQTSVGQGGYDSSHSMKTQQQPGPGDDLQASSVKTFSGRITKSGNRLVLTDADNKTTYQLDDQQRAHDFLNKSVKVTGVLDATTGTIRITAIQLL